MGWRDRLLPGRFRGVAFEVDSAAYDGGRRAVVHEYPGRDDPLVEDLGRRGRRFSIEALVLGPDYDQARDTLRDALEDEGAGLLEHPYYGRVRVRVAEVSLRETTEEGGLARFSITFHEDRAPSTPTALDTLAALKSRSTSLLAQAQAAFTAAYNVAALPGAYVAELQGDVDSLLAGVERVVAGATGSAAALIRLPANLAASIAGSLNRVRALLNDPLQAFGLYKDTFDASPAATTLPTATPARKAQAAARAELTALVQRVAIGEAAGALADATFDNATQATEARDALLEAAEAHLDGATDELYPALMELRTAVVQDIAARGANLARVVRYTPPITLPAVVIAHRLYGDAGREGEIVDRNGLRHPGFVAGGAELEVLSDVT